MGKGEYDFSRKEKMITVIILAKNEEGNIVDCLESVSFADEVIVIDDESTDRTFEVSRQNGAKVLKRKLDHDFSKQRNFALSQATHEWVLFLDADERVDKDLVEEIKQAVLNESIDGYFLRRVDKLFGKILTYGELLNKKFVRLARKNSGKWTGTVHEEWSVGGKLSTLKNPILHVPHQTIAEFIREINYYTTLRAKELYSNGVRVSWYGIIFYTKAKFIQTYVLRLGFLEGMPGLILSLIMSLHSFLVRGKLYLLQNKK